MIVRRRRIRPDPPAVPQQPVLAFFETLSLWKVSRRHVTNSSRLSTRSRPARLGISGAGLVQTYVGR